MTGFCRPSSQYTLRHDSRRRIEPSLQDVQRPRGTRVAVEMCVLIINVWRPLKTIRKDPLTVCDWQSVDVPNDIASNRMIWKDGSWDELGKINFSEEEQKWCYLGGQRPDEPLLFTQYDSKAENSVTLPHSAFVNSEFATGEARESIEIRMFAFVQD